MKTNPPPTDVVHALDAYSGGKLTRHRDLSMLVGAAQRTGREDVLADLSFHAKFVAAAARTLQRIGPEGTGAATLSAEMQNGLAKVKDLTGTLLAGEPEEERSAFTATYFQLTPAALQDLLALCYDLGWYKNWLLDSRRPRTAAHRPSALWRGAIVAVIAGAVLWLGAVHARALLASDLFIRGTLTLNPSVPPAVEQHVYRQLAVQTLVMVPGYLLVLAGSIIVLARSPYRPREHGWLMMSAILLFVFIPVEVFTMHLDIRMAHCALIGSGDLATLRELFLARAGALAGAPVVAQLCYYTIIVLAAVQPFRRGHGDPA